MRCSPRPGKGTRGRWASLSNKRALEPPRTEHHRRPHDRPIQRQCGEVIVRSALAHEIAGHAQIGAQCGNLYDAPYPGGDARSEQRLGRALVNALERLIAVLAQNADGVDDYIDASELRQPLAR
jgi:hypothetical protein